MTNITAIQYGSGQEIHPSKENCAHFKKLNAAVSNYFPFANMQTLSYESNVITCVDDEGDKEEINLKDLKSLSAKDRQHLGNILSAMKKIFEEAQNSKDHPDLDTCQVRGTYRHSPTSTTVPQTSGNTVIVNCGHCCGSNRSDSSESLQMMHQILHLLKQILEKLQNQNQKHAVEEFEAHNMTPNDFLNESTADFSSLDTTLRGAEEFIEQFNQNKNKDN